MKYIIFLLLPFTCKAQNYDKEIADIKTRMQLAGSDLKKYSKRQYTGIVVGLAGAGFTAIALTSKDQEKTKGIMQLGATAMTVGFAITLFSHQKIADAGKILIGTQYNDTYSRKINIFNLKEN